MSKPFSGHLMTFDKKGEGEEIMDDPVLVEFTQMTVDSSIELAFTDRNERCYLKFKLTDLMTAIADDKGEKA